MRMICAIEAALSRCALGVARRGAARCAAIGALLVAACATRAIATPPPNIVIVLMDDMAWSGLSVQMDPNDPTSKSDYHQTPVLEQLAQQGMVFTNSYGGGPMCSPSRAAIMAGKSPAQLQVTDVRHAGNYRDVQFINWYNGFPLTPPQSRNHFPEELSIMEAIKETAPAYKGGFFGKYDWQPNMPWEKWDSYYDMVGWQYTPQDPIAMWTNTNKAMTFMEQKVALNQPFVTFVSHDATKWDNNPNTRSLAETRAYFESLPPGQRHNNPAFAAMYKDADTVIGLLLDKINTLGVANNTYVIFTSDQGASADLGNSAVNGPLFEGKGSLYEGGIRTPLIIKGPGVTPGTYSDVPVTSADLYSTILDMAGRTALPANTEGVSLKPILTNGGDLPSGQTALQRPYGPNGELFFHYPHYTGRFVDDGNGNYHYNPVSPLNAIPTPESAIIDGDYKLIRFYGERGAPDKYLLFNIAQNPLESADLNSPLNLASQYPEKVTQLSAKLDAWLEGVDASMPYDVSAPVEMIWNADSPGTTLLPNSATKIWRTVNDLDSLPREEWYAHGSRTQGPSGSPPTTTPAVIPARVAVNPHQPGLPGHAYNFDGNDGFSHAFFHVSDATRPAFFDADHSASLETWVRFADFNGNQLLFESGGSSQGLSLTMGDADGDGAGDELRFRVLGKTGNQLTVTAEVDRYADPTRDFVHIAAVVSDAPTNRYVELYVNGALAGRVNGTAGATTLDWDGFESASMGRLGLGEFNVDTLGAAAGAGPLPFSGGNLRGDVASFRFLNTALSPAAIRARYNAALDPVSAGVISHTGAVATPAERPSNVSPGAFESAQLQVVQERSDVLGARVTVDAVVTGTANVHSPGVGAPRLPVGTDFNSYLLHFDPVGATVGGLQTITGSITFDEDIIGLIARDSYLDASDARLGSIGNYGDALRGIVWSPGDYLTVDSNQRTLNFQLSTPTDQLLQFRVLTGALGPLTPIVGDFTFDGYVTEQDLAVWSEVFANGSSADTDGDGDSDGADFLAWQRNLEVTAPAAHGDYTADGFVDGADLAVWKSAYGNVVRADADGDADVDGLDFLAWQRQLGATPSSQYSGDFNGDAVINGSDLAIWKASFGAIADADSDGDGDTDGADFLTWQRHLNPAALPAATHIPEASSWVQALIALLLGGSGRARRLAPVRLPAT